MEAGLCQRAAIYMCQHFVWLAFLLHAELCVCVCVFLQTTYASATLEAQARK